MTRTTRWCLAAGLAVLPARAAHAQTIWTPLDHRITARLEFFHPHLKSDAGFGSVSSTSGPLFFSVGFPLNESFAATFELPYGRGAVKNDPLIGDYSDNTVGNPYMGIQFGSLKKPVSLVGEAGFRLAAASENSPVALGLGILGDFERFEAFIPKTNIIAAAGNVVIRRRA